MSLEFEGKKLLVVGGSSGMGLSAARQVLEGGGRAVIVGRDEAKLAQAVRGLAASGRADAVAADVSTAEGLRRLRALIAQEQGGFDLLVNAAGVFAPKAFLENTEADYDRYHALSRAAFFVSQEFAQQLIAARRPGAIVNIGSMWARQAIEATPSAAYSMAKAGLHALTSRWSSPHTRSASTRSLPRWWRPRSTRASFRGIRFTLRFRGSTRFIPSAGSGRRTMSDTSSRFCSPSARAGSRVRSGMWMVA
jgi:NAD(P)-dependent dehydrogenase (short-subunit alcohol dehydrogenase family)